VRDIVTRTRDTATRVRNTVPRGVRTCGPEWNGATKRDPRGQNFRNRQRVLPREPDIDSVEDGTGEGRLRLLRQADGEEDQLSALSYQLSAISSQLSAISSQLSALSSQLSAISYQLSSQLQLSAIRSR